MKTMLQRISKLLDYLSEFLSHRKGLLPIIGILLILLNFIFRLWPVGWFTETDFLLHLGLVLAIFGFMLVWAL